MESSRGSLSNFDGEIDASQLKRIKRIASGGMSEIHLYEWTKPEYSFKVAVKCLAMTPIEKRYKSHLESEMSILADLQHENIVKTFGTIIAGMKYLHGRVPKVLHLDIKSDNILLDDTLQAKSQNMFAGGCSLFENLPRNSIKIKNEICNFGLSTMSTLASLKSATTSVGACQPDAVPGTSCYISPTRLRHYQAEATDKSDVYSFGILQWEILTDRQPYEDTELPRNLNLLSIHVGSKSVRPDIELVPTAFPPELTNMMIKAWSQDRKDRPDFHYKK